jgi:DNA-binding ferritin-like protein
MDAMSASNIKYDLDMNANNPLQMLSSLYNSNEQMLVDLKECFNVATSANEQGLANFIAERIDMQEKLGWKLRASMKSMGSN